jgi:hypothetical protein
MACWELTSKHYTSPPLKGSGNTALFLNLFQSFKSAEPEDPALIESNCDRAPKHHLPVQGFAAKNKTTPLNPEPWI